MNPLRPVRFFSFASAVVLSLTCFSTQAQFGRPTPTPTPTAPTIVLLTDDGTANSGDPLPVALTATGITSTPLTQVGLDPNINIGGVWPTAPWDSATVDPSTYLSVTITPDPGVSIDYNQIRVDTRAFSPLIDGAAVRTSLDNFTADVAADDFVGPPPFFFPTTPNPLQLDISSLADITSDVEFRLYFTSSDPSLPDDSYADIATGNGFGISFTGFVVPEPGSLGLLTLGGVVALRRRR